MSTAIGIDLGTTCSVAAVHKKGRVEVFYNEQDSRTTPSYVAYIDELFIVGEEAKSQIKVDPINVVYDAKRLLGRDFEDENVQENIKHWTFKVESVGGKPRITMRNEREQISLKPEEVSAHVLTKLKTIAEEQLEETVSKAVITVPANFNANQRHATLEAAKIANFESVTLLDEPTAAAIAFYFKKKEEAKKNIFVYDFGGGTFDASVLCIENGKINVIAVNGNTHLGGRDFDKKILEYFIAEIERKYGVNIVESEYKKSLARLREKCEDLKIRLSAPRRTKAQIVIDALFDGKDFLSEMTVSKFNEICDELMRRTLIETEKALLNANMQVSDFDDILLIGGSTKIPKIRQLVEEFFGKPVDTSNNPDEAVAVGAAIYASLQDSSMNTSNKQRLNKVQQYSKLSKSTLAKKVPQKRNAEYDFSFKLMVIGDASVGKTCLILRFADDTYTETYNNTIGVDIKFQIIELNGKRIKLEIWDTAGQERFHSLPPSCYQKTHGIIVVYDITNFTSFLNVRQWMKEIDQHASYDTVKVLVGNKCDLSTKKAIDTYMAKKCADELRIPFLETSAKNSANVDEAFFTIATEIMSRAYASNHQVDQPLSDLAIVRDNIIAQDNTPHNSNVEQTITAMAAEISRLKQIISEKDKRDRETIILRESEPLVPESKGCCD